MRNTATATAEGSFARGVDRGRKEVRDGDYTHAVLGVVVMLVMFVMFTVAFARLVRWVLR